MLSIPSTGHYTDQFFCFCFFLTEEMLDSICGYSEHQTTTLAHRRGFLTLNPSDTQHAWFSHILDWPPSFSVSAFSFISQLSQIAFQSTLKPLEHQSMKTKAYVSSFSKKHVQGSRCRLNLTYPGTCLLQLARERYGDTAKKTSRDCSLLCCTYFPLTRLHFTVLH